MNGLFSRSHNLGIPESVLAVCIGAQQILLLVLLASTILGTTDTIKDGSFVCWYYFQNCVPWIFMTGPGTAFSLAWYGLLCIATLFGVYFAVATNKHGLGKALLLLGWSWIVVHEFVLSYAVGHAYDYVFILLAGTYLFSSQGHRLDALVYTLVTIHVCGALFIALVSFDTSSSLGDVAHVSSVVSNCIVGLGVALGLATTLLLMPLSRTEKVVIVGGLCGLYTYAAFTLTHEWIYASVVMPYLLVLFLGKRQHIPRLPSKTHGVFLCLLVVVLVSQWYRTTFEEALCMRPHLGVATSLNVAVCTSTLYASIPEGDPYRYVYTSPSDRPCRCDPYTRWFIEKKKCETTNRDVITWTLTTKKAQHRPKVTAHSENICTSSFDYFKKPDWLIVESAE